MIRFSKILAASLALIATHSMAEVLPSEAVLNAKGLRLSNMFNHTLVGVTRDSSKTWSLHLNSVGAKAEFMFSSGKKKTGTYAWRTKNIICFKDLIDEDPSKEICKYAKPKGRGMDWRTVKITRKEGKTTYFDYVENNVSSGSSQIVYYHVGRETVDRDNFRNLKSTWIGRVVVLRDRYSRGVGWIHFGYDMRMTHVEPDGTKRTGRYTTSSSQICLRYDNTKTPQRCYRTPLKDGQILWQSAIETNPRFEVVYMTKPYPKPKTTNIASTPSKETAKTASLFKAKTYYKNKHFVNAGRELRAVLANPAKSKDHCEANNLLARMTGEGHFNRGTAEPQKAAEQYQKQPRSCWEKDPFAYYYVGKGDENAHPAISRKRLKKFLVSGECDDKPANAYRCRDAKKLFFKKGGTSAEFDNPIIPKPSQDGAKKSDRFLVVETPLDGEIAFTWGRLQNQVGNQKEAAKFMAAAQKAGNAEASEWLRVHAPDLSTNARILKDQDVMTPATDTSAQDIAPMVYPKVVYSDWRPVMNAFARTMKFERLSDKTRKTNATGEEIEGSLSATIASTILQTTSGDTTAFRYLTPDLADAIARNYTKASHFHNGRALVRRSVGGDDHLFVIDEAGKELVSLPLGTYTYGSRPYFGRIKIRADKREGLITTKGALIAPLEYTEFHMIEAPVAAVRTPESGKLYGAASIWDGSELAPAIWESVHPMRQGNFVTRRKTTLYIFDQTGEMIATFKNATLLHTSAEGVVTIKTDDGIDYIGPDGESIVPRGYTAISRFNQDRGAISSGRKIGFIDHTGDIAIKAKWRSKDMPAHWQEDFMFRKGLACMQLDKVGQCIDRTGALFVTSPTHIPPAMVHFGGGHVLPYYSVDADTIAAIGPKGEIIPLASDDTGATKSTDAGNNAPKTETKPAQTAQNSAASTGTPPTSTTGKIADVEHGRKIRSAAYSADERIVATIGNTYRKSAELRVWDVETGALLFAKDFPEAQLRGASVRPQDGHYLITVASEEGWFEISSRDWKITPVKMNESQTSIGFMAGFDRGRRAVTRDYKGNLFVWDLENHRFLEDRRPAPDSEKIKDVVIADTGIALVSYNRDKLRVMDLGPSRTSTAIDIGEAKIQGLAITPDGETLAVATKEDVQFFDKTGKRVAQTQVDKTMTDLIFASDGKSVIARQSVSFGAAAIWRVGMDGTAKVMFKHGNYPDISGIFASPSRAHNLIAAAREAETIFAEDRGPTGTTLGAEREILRDVAYAPKTNLIALAFDDFVSVHDGTTFETKRIVDTPNTPRTYLAFTADGETLTMTQRKQIVQLRIADGSIRNHKHINERLDGSLAATATSPDGALLAVLRQKAIQVYDLETGKHIAEISQPETRLSHIAFGADNNTLVLADYKLKTARVYDLSQRAFVRAIEGKNIRLSPRGGMIATRDDREITLIRASDGEEIQRLSDTYHYSMDWSADGQYFAGGVSKETRIYPLESGAKRIDVPRRLRDIESLFIRDGEVVSLSNDSSAMTISTETRDTHLVHVGRNWTLSDAQGGSLAQSGDAIKMRELAPFPVK